MVYDGKEAESGLEAGRWIRGRMSAAAGFKESEEERMVKTGIVSQFYQSLYTECSQSVAILYGERTVSFCAAKGAGAAVGDSV